MRESKFRAKAIYNGEWLIGDLIKNSIIDPFTYISIGIGYRVDDERIGKLIKVYPDSVGEFIGMKDKNNLEMCEGDICKTYQKFYEIPSPLIVKIVYNENLACFEPQQYWASMKKFISLVDRFEMYDFEIIGNTYENGDLLK